MSDRLTYKSSGVDVEKASALVHDIAELRKRTEKTKQLYQAFGLFSASYDLSGYNSPVIVTGCDGVGTKIEPLLRYGLYENAGVDLVGMNVNDVLTSNALPLMFLDYIGVARIEEEKIRSLIIGISRALESCECILAGGETAEMPGLVEKGMMELSGFCIGAAEKEDLVDPTTVTAGDVVIGVPSDGFHANGWSLIRRVILEYPDLFSEDEIIELLTPTRIYFKELRAAQKAGIRPKGMAHITGGGIPENLERITREHGASLKLPYWDNAPVQKVLGCIDEAEAIKTFNMGIGWMFIVSPDDEKGLLDAVPESVRLGEVGGGEIHVEVLK